MRVGRVGGAGVLALLLAGAGWAAELTEKTSEAVCSITQVRVCRSGSECETSAPADLGTPDLVLVSLEDKAFFALGEAHAGKRSEFRVVERTPARWVLQGYERNRAWSAIIGADGALSLAAADTGVAVSASGRCVDAAWLRD
jgi:hypothetical protein